MKYSCKPYRAVAFTVEGIRVRNRSIATSVGVSYEVVAKRYQTSGTKTTTQSRVKIIDL